MTPIDHLEPELNRNDCACLASPRELADRFLYLRHVRTVSAPFVEAEILIDPNESQALAPRCLEVQVWIGDLELPYAEIENPLRKLGDGIGLELQPNGPATSQKCTLVRNVSIQETDVKIISQTDEVPVGIGLHHASAEHFTIEAADRIPFMTWYQN
ncbi:MAG: hypothetical protein ACXWC4_00940 [Telluria sp.]